MGNDEPRAALLDADDVLCGLTDVDLVTLFDMETVLLALAAERSSATFTS